MLLMQDLRHTKYVRMVEQAILGGAVPEGAPQPAQASTAGKSAAQNAFAQEK